MADDETDLLFNVALEKGEKGFGIYFFGNAAGRVIVEGFVPTPDGGSGPAELLGCIEANDVLERINGEDITTLQMAAVVDRLRNAPLGLNGLTFRRRVADTNAAAGDEESAPSSRPQRLLGALKGVLLEKAPGPKSPQWWTEFHRLKAANVLRWEAASVTESDFIEALYAGSDDQQKSYLRQEYPTLLSHHQDRFTVWPRPAQVCPVTPYSGRCAATSIAPSPCLATLVDTLRTSLGWTRHETSAFLVSLQATAHVHSAVDYVCARREALTLPLSVAYPRITRAVWSTLDEAALQLLAPDDASYIASLPSYVCS
ncbi:hypothetical protein SPRG_14792 [Saprolegnia parasitica CBS 223.65]|uniref:PDZ domain-containing protein n=1 Tax=Saprolegnia parasitica (strain CBS 223.65) TaxID=695850 RepID=A0A067BQZ1_SAPPC|nr:hypothetical protein SPRG_14792 [Saprolegnia parasitica CBS 223.65]KDO19180.1 hypothetical protein SPRG_14792 [Saprolegnia parasitica CBS 223.65]|eukprot:XP_012210114.1 hypothetical protein SPRG_14792 [Saprolegnia parasitica CBS 223.65]